MTARQSRPAARDVPRLDGGSSQHPHKATNHLPEGREATPAEPGTDQPQRAPTRRHPVRVRRTPAGALPPASLQDDAATTLSRHRCTRWTPPSQGRHGSERPDRLLTVDEVAQWLGKPKTTLYVWRTRGLGPRGIKVGNALRYRRRDVETWLDQHTDDR
jgi:predicted DNA-binding transcriptional regulator AlpA